MGEQEGGQGYESEQYIEDLKVRSEAAYRKFWDAEYALMNKYNSQSHPYEEGIVQDQARRAFPEEAKHLDELERESTELSNEFIDATWKLPTIELNGRKFPVYEVEIGGKTKEQIEEEFNQKKISVDKLSKEQIDAYFRSDEFKKDLEEPRTTKVIMARPGYFGLLTRNVDDTSASISKRGLERCTVGDTLGWVLSGGEREERGFDGKSYIDRGSLEIPMKWEVQDWRGNGLLH